MKPRLSIGLIGHGFMGRAHSHALHDLEFFFDPGVAVVRKTLCGIGDDVAGTAARYGWQGWTNSWEEVIADPEIDAVSICTPGDAHREIAVAAAQAGKHVLCEKPLANSLAEALDMYEAARSAAVKHVVNFNYRKLPAVALARRFLQQGRLGEVRFFRATYFQDWALSPDVPFLWRFDKAKAGAGSMADNGSHIIDLARWLVGEFAEVAGTAEITVKERRSVEDGAIRPVTTDDTAAFLARFENGAIGLFATNRTSAGHKNALVFEVTGARGALVFDLERLNELQVYFYDEAPERQGFRTIMVTDPSHPYISRWWPPGHVIGWEHGFVHQYYEFVKAIAEDATPSPTFYDGMKAQAVLEAIETAWRGKRWAPVPDTEA